MTLGLKLFVEQFELVGKIDRFVVHAASSTGTHAPDAAQV
jgi:hypothetical protein